MMETFYRGRRYRENPILRRALQETTIDRNKLIQPVFFTEAPGSTEVSSMPGMYRHSVESSLPYLERLLKKGINKIIAFGIPAEKDETGSAAFESDGIIQKALRETKKRFGNDLYLITDVCMCEYTSHGHCGIIRGNNVDNDATLPYLGKIALSHVDAGADMVAPSDMMDGRVGIIRNALDTNGYTGTPILAYSIKFASSFYGPFRDAAGSTPGFGDRKGYQLNPPNSRISLLEAYADMEEGADILMVKPALPYLDILKELRISTKLPLAAYQVSGEYSMIKAAVEKGWLEEKSAVRESLVSIFRAGADLVITYFAEDLDYDQ